MKFRMSAVVQLGGAMGTATVGAEEFKVGAHMPLTRNPARSGAGFNEGIAAAADIFNRSNGKHKIKMVVIDDESAPAKAVAAVVKLHDLYFALEA
jgi:branched-chain amino acid transport system substrate-binding protein